MRREKEGLWKGTKMLDIPGKALMSIPSCTSRTLCLNVGPQCREIDGSGEQRPEDAGYSSICMAYMGSC